MRSDDRKTARFEARIPVAVHALLQHAAELQGRSMTDFVVAAAREAAENAVGRHDTLELSLADRKRFAEALLAPPAISPALERALAANRQLIDPT